MNTSESTPQIFSPEAKPLYRLPVDRTLELGLRLVGTWQLSYAEEVFAHLHDRPALVIHELRKFTKRTRALIKLLSPLMTREDRRQLLMALRKLSAALAPSRESVVHAIRFHTLLTAQGAGRLPLDTAILNQLETKALEEQQKVLSSSALPRLLTTSVSKLGDWLGKFQVETPHYDHLRMELRNDYRRARKSMAAAMELKESESMHHWRKQVKILWYHLRLLQNHLNAEGQVQLEVCDELGSLLGDIHDLDTLKACLQGLRQDPIDAWAGEGTQTVWNNTREHLLADVETHSQNLFSLKPGEFISLIQ